MHLLVTFSHHQFALDMSEVNNSEFLLINILLQLVNVQHL